MFQSFSKIPADRKGQRMYLECTDEINNQVRKLFEVGLNINEIAIVLNISESDIEKLGYVSV